MRNRPIRILLVEDNTADVYLFRKALAGADLDFEMTIFENGCDALEFVRREGTAGENPVPDLAVLDLNLPKNDGLQVLEAMRKTERFANVAVVVTSSAITAQPVPPQLRIARYIPKPADLDDFLKIGSILKAIVEESGR